MNQIISIAIGYLLFFSISISAQSFEWNNCPKKGFVFEISNDEAQRLLSKNNPDTIFAGLLHTLIDTFDVEVGWNKRPNKGHYILTEIKANKLYCNYTSVFPYQVFLFKEYDALSLQVLDLNGNVRKDAIVKLKHKRLRLDPESKTYRIENRWFRGNKRTTTVELEGFRSVFNIEKHEVPSWQSNYNYDSGPEFYSYMITDKNKYKPQEKVRFKSYALSQGRWPLRKTLEIWLRTPKKYEKIGTIEPHRPGSYAGEFHLHDSLNLVLDRIYYLELRDKSGRKVSSCQFKYEDYELFGNKLDLQLSSHQQYFPDDNKLTITATDENGLILKDAKASVFVKVSSLLESFQTVAILNDTLLFSQIKLDPAKPTEIIIPSDIFQKTNSIYEIIVTVLNSENERIVAREMATHYYSQYELTSHFSNDSICFNLFKNGESIQNIPTELRYNNNLVSQKIHLPYKEKLNASIEVFHLKNEFLSKEITLSHLNPELILNGGIQKDSFNINLQNSLFIDVSWYIYQGSQLLQKGFGKELNFASLIEDRTKTYYVEIFYSFGGVEHVKRRQFVFQEEHLNVSLNVPERIYPGQEVDASILVTNELGLPVRGVDLTALATTSKLNYNLPDLPYYGSNSAARPKTAHFTKQELKKRSAILELNYAKWKDLARLDTMKYYQFTYPISQSFKYVYTISDSTQFAPFVMDKGRAKEIYVIEVNRKPVYYSWADNPKNYSFYVSPIGKKEVTLRLHDRVIVLDSIHFEANNKTILSFDIDNLPVKTKVHKLSTRFSGMERNRHLTYISSFKCKDYRYAYLESATEFTPLFERSFSNVRNVTIGPIAHDYKTYSENGSYKIRYRHAGGFNYAFEDNVVYKQNDTTLLPRYLYSNYFEPLKRVSDLVMTKKQFIENTKTPVYKPNKWFGRTIDLSKSNSRIRILLPFDKEKSGLAAILFEDCYTKNTKSQYFGDGKYYQKLTNDIPKGLNNIIVLYNNGTYLKMDSIPIKAYIIASIDFNKTGLNAIDSLSQYWLAKHIWDIDQLEELDESFTTEPYYDKYYSYTYQNSTGNVTGTIFDESGKEPLPGVNIVIKGTNIGTVTDLDGHFALNIDNYEATLQISFIGYITVELNVTIGSELSVELIPDMLALDEIVVIGYGTVSNCNVTGSISSISGNMVTPPDDQEYEVEQEISETAEQQLYQELLNLNTIRSNFSDVGFWEPRLYTNRRGESKFRITFPDDITQWNAVVYAMNQYLKTGTARKSIKSFKPIMAELHVPQFLTRGDSALFIGKVLNYTSDTSIFGKVSWRGANSDFEKDIQFSQFYTEKLPVKVSTLDSITSSFTFKRDDGYFDGEERTVSVVEQGIIRANGSLLFLQNNETKDAKAQKGETVTIEILDNQIDIYKNEVKYLLNYKYACNEQLASKLTGLVSYKILTEYEGQKFEYDRDVNKIIERLLKNQNNEFLWSWWDNSAYTSYWMSAHILRALKYAKDQGYTVELNVDNIARKAKYKFDFLKDYSINDIDLIHALASWNANLDYPEYIGHLDSIISENENYDPKIQNYYYRYSYLKEKLLLQETKQIIGLPIERDSILKYKKEGMLGEVFFDDNKINTHWYNDKLATNLIAYRIVRNDSILNKLRIPMQMYFISSREGRVWNTYQSANAILTVLSDLLTNGNKLNQKSTVKLSGKVNELITAFPYKIELQPEEELNIRKESGLPMYYMQYTKERVFEAKTGVEGFEIKTYFRNKSMQLKAGEPLELIVEVDVTKDASCEYVMIEVPIPGGCSYGNKKQSYWSYETHREYFKERTVIFCQNLPKGTHEFKIDLLPRFTGKYILNPAQVSLMYVPVVNANTDMKNVLIVDEE